MEDFEFAPMADVAFAPMAIPMGPQPRNGPQIM